MAQANVYTTATAQTWYTDKARITTGSNTVTYQVDLIYPSAAGNIFSEPAQIASFRSQDVYIGVGNKLTVVGGNCTIQEIGTATSGSAGVI